jgi:hypothetical protein
MRLSLIRPQQAIVVNRNMQHSLTILVVEWVENRCIIHHPPTRIIGGKMIMMMDEIFPTEGESNLSLQQEPLIRIIMNP